MTKTIKLALVAAMAMGATSAFATNGDVLIGIGAKARGMGGVGIGMSHGAESAHMNPALITSIKGNNEISFGGTLFMPDLQTTNSLFGPDGAGGYAQGPVTTADSDADTFVIPSVSLATKINDNWYWGLGMWGTGGLGVDYRDTAESTLGGSHMSMVTSLQLMQFGVPLAYTNNGMTIGVTPIIQYGALDINYENPMAGDATVGAGVSDDIAFGFNVGLAYETNGFTIGAVYKSEIEMDFEDVLQNAISPMLQANPGSVAAYGAGMFPFEPTSSEYTNSKLSSPEEYGIGVSYTTGGHTLAVDYKLINWEDAETYKDFGWEDQDVIAIGYEYATDTWAVRCGYQYAESAVQDNKDKGLALDGQFQAAGNYSPMTGQPLNLTNTFNLLGFPGTQESHVTIGGTYAFNETLSMDIAAVFALENTESATNFSGVEISTDHSEDSYSIQINYNF